MKLLGLFTGISPATFSATESFGTEAGGSVKEVFSGLGKLAFLEITVQQKRECFANISEKDLIPIGPSLSKDVVYACFVVL